MGTILKICRICGKEFIAKQSNYVCCSAECQQINRNITHQKALANMTESQKEDRRRKMREYFHRKKKAAPPKLCSICSQPLPNKKQVWCLDCMLRDYVQHKNKSLFAKRLYCRGYNKEMILDEIKQKGW